MKLVTVNRVAMPRDPEGVDERIACEYRVRRDVG